ncbi:hypothetical protein XHV734_0798 [Xanthomonas hortorum pv. vitians]|nr:hypothetical protein XHV734_0798 [Xanthomonas hortorum pv. vitians]
MLVAAAFQALPWVDSGGIGRGRRLLERDIDAATSAMMTGRHARHRDRDVPDRARYRPDRTWLESERPTQRVAGMPCVPVCAGTCPAAT